ncbi:hypothetical protein RHGRI_028937 [Rhododendron griersonianum]|uniref:EF-hand domain-containing protein n=1 Tax=Rhododendron griersonianum TaxID=479676 RepID=A0AAV6IKW0_9ERIC|nr:hypothetical protein RHGRI_028937 [Rhododendron griersonianum]
MAPEELARLYDSIFEKFDCDGSMFLHLEEFHFGSPATTARTVAGIVIEQDGDMVDTEEKKGRRFKSGLEENVRIRMTAYKEKDYADLIETAKKIGKDVPGKSAKDCFNKLRSDHSTPPQPQPRWRSRKTNSPSYSLLTSTLLKPEEPITEKPSRRKQNRHLAQKTVRKLVQKHYNVNQNYEDNLFSVLESTMNPSTQALQKSLTYSTPGGEQKDSGYLKKCRDRSSSAHHAKNMSQLSGSYGATLASPPVLKPVKNKALLEKYIDQLHCREAKRRAAKVIRGKENRKDSWINIQNQKTDVIKLQKMLWFLISINSIR